MYTVIGDPHITHKSLDRAETLFDIIEDLGNPTILLGDILDTKEIIRGKCLNYVYERLRSSKLEYIILVGNHDWFNLECKDHSLKTLGSLPNVTIVDKPKKLNLQPGNRTAIFLPYYEDTKQFEHELAKATKAGADVAFIHQGITGFDYGNGYIADGNGHGELDPGSISGITRVISGHFHKFAEDKNLTFLGTPFSHSFGETDQIKYIGLYDPHDDELKLLETPFPRHRTLEINLENASSMTVAENALKGELERSEKDIIRVVIHGSEEMVKAFDKSKFQGVKFIEKPWVNEEDSSLLDETDSNEKIFKTWATEIKGLDKNTIKLGLEILEEVK